MSVVEKLLSKLASRATSKAQSAEQRYLALAIQISTGQEPAVETLESVLDAAGKTTAGLLDDVKRITRRKELKALVDRLPSIQKEMAELDQKATAVRAKLEAAKQEHDQALWPLHGRYRELEDMTAKATSARSELSSSMDQGLAAELEALNEKRKALNQHAQGVANQRERVEVQVNIAEEKNAASPGCTLSAAQVNEMRQRQIAGAAPEHAILKEILAQEAELQKAMKNLDDQGEAIREKMVAAAL